MHLEEDGRVSLEIVADLTRHQRAVNAVRWSPSGKYLASADDESAIFIWKQREENETINVLGKNIQSFSEDRKIIRILCRCRQ